MIACQGRVKLAVREETSALSRLAKELFDSATVAVEFAQQSWGEVARSEISSKIDGGPQRGENRMAP